jgi:outer membrane protein assembly factor BamA/autotransporter translocation and assembly factor TamB
MRALLRSRALRFLAGAAAAALIGAALLHAPPVRERVLRYAIAKAAAAGYVIHAEAIDYNLFTLSAHLSGLTVATAGSAAVPFFSAADVRVSLPRSVIAGRFGLDRVEIISPKVVLRRDRLGRDNWTTESRRAPAPGAIAVHLNRLIVSTLSVDWTDETRSAHVDAELSLDLSGDARRIAGPIVMARPANVRWRDRATTISVTGGRLSWNDRDLSIESLSMKAPEGTVRVDGRFDDLLRTARIATSVDATADLDALSPWLALPRPLEGTAQVSARLDAAGVEITNVRARVAGGEIAGKGRAAFDGAGALQITWEQIELSDLLKGLLVNVPRVLPAAQAAGSLDAQWSAPQLDALRLTVNGRLRANREAARRSDVPVDATLRLTLRDRKFTLSGDAVDVLGLGSAVALDGTVDPSDLLRSTVTGTLQARANGDAIDWNALVRAGWLDAVPPVHGNFSGDFRVSGTVGAPALDGDLEASPRYQSMPSGQIRSHASLSADAVSLSGIDARIGEASVSGDLRWSVGSGAIDGLLNGSLPLKELPELAPAIPDSLSLGGSVNVRAGVSGSISKPRIAVQLAGNTLEISGQTIDSLAADAHLDGSDLILERVLAQEGTGRIEAAGTYNLPRGTYTAHATATDVWLHPVLAVNGETNRSISGRLNASFDGTGTLNNLGGRGHLAVADARWGSADAGLAAADFTLAGDRATFTFEAADLALSGHGTMGVNSSGPLVVAATWQPADAAAIARRFALTLPVSGSAGVSAEWTATRDRPAEGRGWIRLDSADLTIASQRMTLEKQGRVDVDGREVRVTPFVLATGSSRLTVDGALPSAPASGRISLTLDGSLADFGFVRDLIEHEVEDSREPLPLTGSINVQLVATGTTTQPRIAGTLRIGAGRFAVTQGHDVTDIELGARYENGVLTMDQATAVFEGSTLSATARVPGGVFADRLPDSIRGYLTPAPGTATVSAQLRSITQSIAAPWLDAATLQQIGLGADASIELESDRFEIGRVRGTVVLGRAEFSLAGVSFNQETTTRLAIRDGRLTIDAFRLGQADNQVAIEGGVMLSGDAALDLSAKGVLDLRLLNALVPTARTVGRGDFGIRVGGPARTPTIDGFLTLSNGETRIADPRVVVGDVNGTVTFRGDTITFERLSATMNGGDAELAGSLRLRGAAGLDGSVALTVDDAALDISGLRAESNAALTWTIDANGPTLGGTVTLTRSAYRERISLSGSLLSALRGSSVPVPPARSPSLIDRTRLDVHLVTGDDLVIDNNVAQLTLRSDLRAVGTVSKPSVTGRATLGEGGQVFFNGTRYRIQDQGSIDFANPARIEPDLDITAVARVQDHDISVVLKGTPATLEATLNSDPADLSQSDMASLLLIGRTTSGADASSVGSDELVGLLASGFLDAAGRAVGLDTVRVERGTPDVRLDAGLVAAETDPGARLTFGKNIGSHWDVVFSQSLQQSGGLTWIVGYKPRSGIDLRVVSLDSGDRLYTFSHDLTFGGPARTVSTAFKATQRVSVVDVGGAGSDEAAIRSRLKLQPGDRFSFFQWQDDRERLESFYREREHLEARVSTRRVSESTDAGHVRLVYDVRPGPKTTVVVEGFRLSKSGTTGIEQAWERSIADDFLIEETTAMVRADLANEGFLSPSVTTRMDTVADAKQLRVVIAQGTRAATRRVEFTGNASESSSRLQTVLAGRGLTRAVWTSPDETRDALLGFYRANGYLKAAIAVEPIAMRGSEAIRTIRIDESGAARVASVQVDGVKSLASEEVTRVVGLKAGDRYTEPRLEEAQRALDAQYRTRGYNRVAIDAQARMVDRSATPSSSLDVDIVVHVDEGPQQRLREIVTTGVRRTKPAIVSRALALDVGAPVDLAAWNAARRRVYETGAFRSVDIQREVLDTPEPSSGGEEPVRANVTVQEWPPLRFKYGLEVRDELTAASDAARSNAPDSESVGTRSLGFGVAGDLTARGLFGTTMSGGISGRYTVGSRASRAYLTSPTFFGRPIVSTVFVEQSREESGNDVQSGTSLFQTLKTDFTVEQRIRLAKRTSISYLFTLERNHTSELIPDPIFPFDVLVTIGKFASAIVFDTRNDLSDASRGWFHSSNVQYAPEALSDVRFVKYYVQQNYYRTFGRIVFATSGRLGLANAFDATLLPDQRFFAGGGNSVRGYDQDVLSPRDLTGGAVGGSALMVFNEELRFPVFKIVRGVGFFDAGRAFERVSDLSFGGLATSAGVGLRVQTPFVLLRVDAGMPFDSAFGPRRPRWFFSIGQMF